MQRALPVALAAVALALAACAESSLLEPGADGPAARAVSPASGHAASSHAASPARPAGGTCTLVALAVLPPLPGQPANVVRRQTDWVCQLQHLGRTTALTTETGTAMASGSSVTGSSVYTAANGDRLLTTFGGVATFPDANGIVTFGGTETVTGGTGRFAGASGSFTRATRVSVILRTGQYELDGTLRY